MQKKTSPSTNAQDNQKLNKSPKRSFSLPVNPNDKFPYDFKTLNYKTDGTIFFITSLVLPFIVTFIMFLFIFINPGISKSTILVLSLLNMILEVISIVIGFTYLYSKHKKLMFSSGIFIFYAFVIFPLILGLIVKLFYSFLVPNLDELVTSVEKSNYEFNSWISSIIVRVVTEVIVIILGFVYDKSILYKIKITFKTRFWNLFGVVLISLIIFLILSSISASLNNLINNESKLSENDVNLTSWLGDSNISNVKRIIGSIFLVVLTIFIAPLCEEMAVRHAFIKGCGHPLYGFFGSAIYFAFMHVSSSMDLQHIFSYILSAFFISGLFIFVNGNLTYTWLVHLLANIIPVMSAIF